MKLCTPLMQQTELPIKNANGISATHFGFKLLHTAHSMPRQMNFKLFFEIFQEKAWPKVSHISLPRSGQCRWIYKIKRKQLLIDDYESIRSTEWKISKTKKSRLRQCTKYYQSINFSYTMFNIGRPLKVKVEK